MASAQSDLKQAALNKEKDEQLLQAATSKPSLNVKLAVAKWEQSASKLSRWRSRSSTS